MMRFWTQVRLVYEMTSGMMSNKFQIRGSRAGTLEVVPGVERGVSDETKLELGSVDRRVAGFPRSG
jgi:hypothetical protein